MSVTRPSPSMPLISMKVSDRHDVSDVTYVTDHPNCDVTLEEINYIEAADPHDEAVKLVRFCRKLYKYECDIYRIAGEGQEELVTSLLNNASCGQATLEIIVSSIALVLAVAMITVNTTGLVVLAKHRSLRSPTNRFFISLAVSDVVFGVTSLYATIINLITAKASVEYDIEALEEILTIRTNRVLCLLVDLPGLLYAAMMAIVLTLTAIAFEKYITVFHPLTYFRIMTRRRISVIVVCIWIVSLLFGFMPLMGWNEFDGTCLFVDKISPSYMLLWACVCLLAAMSTLFMYARIFATARKHARQIHAQEEAVSRACTSEAAPVSPITECTTAVTASAFIPIHKAATAIHANCVEKHPYFAHRKSEGSISIKPSILKRKSMRRNNSHDTTRHSRLNLFSAPIRAVKTIAIILGSFYICWLPLIIYIFVMQEKYSNFILYSISMLTLVNGLVNPIVYGFRSKNIRYRLGKLCHCCRRGGELEEQAEIFSTHIHPS